MLLYCCRGQSSRLKRYRREYKGSLRNLVLFMYKKVKFIKVNLQTKNKSGMHALCPCVLKASNTSDAQPKEQKTATPPSKKYFKSHHYFLPGNLHISDTIKSIISSVFSMVQYLDMHRTHKNLVIHSEMMEGLNPRG